MKEIIKRPVITEKFNKLQEKLNKYTFEVDIKADKKQIRQAIMELYPEVEIKSINTMIVPSKPKGRYTRGGFIAGRSKIWKKAIITLKEGSEIDFYSEV